MGAGQGLVVTVFNHLMHGAYDKKYEVSVLHDYEGANGAGHQATAFENPDSTLRYISKDGTDGTKGTHGDAKYTDRNFNSIADINDYYGKFVSPGKKYDVVAVFSATRAQINMGITVARYHAMTTYDLILSSCTTVVEKSLNAMYKSKIYSGLAIPNLNFFINNLIFDKHLVNFYLIK